MAKFEEEAYSAMCTKALHWVPIPMPMPMITHAHGFWVGMGAILLIILLVMLQFLSTWAQFE